MAAKRKPQQTPPDRNSNRQRKGTFTKAAHQYGQLYEWRKAQDQRFTEKRFRLVAREILKAALRLHEQPEKENNRGESRRQNDQPQLPIAHLLGAGYGYRRNPSKETTERLLTMAVNWYQASEDDKKRRREHGT